MRLKNYVLFVLKMYRLLSEKVFQNIWYATQEILSDACIVYSCQYKEKRGTVIAENYSNNSSGRTAYI